MNKEFYNASGCADSTAYAAINNVLRKDAEARVSLLIKDLKATIAAEGFVLARRIEVKDIKSGIAFK